MTVIYTVHVLHVDHDDRLTELKSAVAAELSSVGLHRAVEVIVTTMPGTVVGGPILGVFFGSAAAASSVGLASAVDAMLARGTVIVPVVDTLTGFRAVVPPQLHFANGFEWSGADPARQFARLLLRYLGLEDRERRVFISHKRDDGLGAAEQLHDQLTHAGFRAFIDRFAIRAGEPVQRVIADALEDYAFLLLLETPLAHTSDWVFDEVDYALSHTMGLLVVRWPVASPVPGSDGVPRFQIDPSELVPDAHGFDTFTPAAVDRLVEEIEGSHARGLVRRRRMLVRNVEEAALARGYSCLPLPEWRLRVEDAGGPTIVGITPRLPTAQDLHELDRARAGDGIATSSVLVHSARVLESQRREHLTWVTDSRALDLVPENAIGARW